MNKSTGIVSVLVGIGLTLVSILFSTGSHPNLSFFGNIPRMEIVLKEGRRIEAKQEYRHGMFVTVRPAYHEGRMAIPLKYALSLGIIVLLSGVGIIALSESFPKKNSEDKADG